MAQAPQGIYLCGTVPSTLHEALLQTVAEKGSRLREVRKDLLRKLPGMTQRWFQGPDGCDLFLWYDEEKGLSQIQLTFERRAVEWSPAEGVRTAMLVSFNPLRPLDDQARIVLDPRPDSETLALARVLLENASVDDVTLAMVRKLLGLR
jgi:hypothetical protein